MKRRAFLGLAAGLGAASVTAACGVPSSSNPMRLANAPTPPGPPEVDVRTLRSPSDATKQDQLVEYFLNAAAGANTIGGDRPKALAEARARMKDFFTTTGAAQWQPGERVLVVRSVVNSPVATADGEWTVKVPCIPLGYLDDHGDIGPVQLVPFTTTFTVVSAGSVNNNPQWRIQSVQRSDNSTADLLLDENGLHGWYDVFPTYFWDPDVDTLVPELRYMPAAISNAKRPAEIVRWLTAGPSSWMSGTLKQLPQEIEVKDSPSWDPDAQHLTLNLSSKAANLDRDGQRNFAIQVWWTLGQGAATVELNIEGASTGIRISQDTALASNAAARGDDPPFVERFCVVDHKVRETDGQSPALLVPSGNPSPNTDVVLAAITRSKRNGALVRQDGKNFRLWLGSVSGTSSDAQAATYAPTAVVGKQFSRPAWISRPERLVMVIVDGKLITVSPVTPNPPGVEVTLPRGLAGPVTAFSVAPDGRRIAFIAGGQLYVAPMMFSDSNTIAILDSFRSVYTPLASQNAVGWGDVVSLVVGGAPAPNTGATLLSVPLASAYHRVLSELSYIIDQVSTYPVTAKPRVNPTVNPPDPLVMIQSSGVAYNVYNNGIGTIDVPASPTPAPSSSAVPPSPNSVSCPFFPD